MSVACKRKIRDFEDEFESTHGYKVCACIRQFLIFAASLFHVELKVIVVLLSKMFSYKFLIDFNHILLLYLSRIID